MFLVSGHHVLPPTEAGSEQGRAYMDRALAPPVQRLLQGYLTHKKPPTLGPYSRPMPRALWWSHGLQKAQSFLAIVSVPLA